MKFSPAFYGKYGSLLGLVCYFLPFFILGENAYVEIHDNLENELVYIKVLIESNQCFFFDNKTLLPNILSGVPRSFFRSGFNFTFLFFYFLKPFQAYVVNSIFVHLVAYWGMLLLLSEYSIFANKWQSFRYWISFSFSIIPFGTIYSGIALSGLPLMIYAFLNLSQGKKIIPSYCLIIFYVFGASLLFISPFLLLMILLLGFGYYYLKGSLSLHYLVGFVVLFVLIFIVEYNFLTHLIFHTEPSHRLAYQPSQLVEFYSLKKINLSFYACFKRSMAVFFYGKWQSGNLFSLPIFSLALIFIGFSKHSFKVKFLIASLLLGLIFFSLFYGFYPMIFDVLHLEKINLQQYHWQRVYLLFPMAWYGILFIIGNTVIEKVEQSIFKIALAVFIGSSVVISFYLENKELTNNISNLFNLEQKLESPSFKAYYAESLYKQISDFIALPKSQYRVASVGIDPAIAIYNGFFTIDGYYNNYPLYYKKMFSKVIAKQLQENSLIADYYNYLGNRNYLFLKTNNYKWISKYQKFPPQEFQYNINALKALKCDFIFSAITFNPHRYLKLIGVFNHSDAHWKIYVYQILA